MSRSHLSDIADQYWDGIDPETRDFIRRMVEERKLAVLFKTAGREWLRACAVEGLSTALNADLADPRYRALFEARCAAATTGIERIGKRHTARVRNGLRFYALAFTHGLRTLPVPAEALAPQQAWSVSVAEARTLLPQADQDKLAAVDELFLRLAQQQYGGDGDRMSERGDGRKHKMTMAYTTQARTRAVMDDFIRQGHLRLWTPFTLDGLLTPERVTEHLYYSTKLDGTYYDERSILQFEQKLLDYIYRARTCGRLPIEIVSAEREVQLREAIRLQKDRKHLWNKRSRRLSNSGPTKWYPTMAHVSGAIAALEEQLARLDDRWEHKRITRFLYWRGLRDAVLTLGTIYGMWRIDTASTISLLHLKKHRSTNDLVDANGFVVVVDSVRAKDTSGEWYPFVKELILPPVLVPLIEKLLTFEGRSLREPLRAGEQPVLLRAEAGDHWGDDPLLVGELAVAPLFRKHVARPEGMTYSAVQKVLQSKLRWLRFGATNPHTLRATGAIYWSFVRGMPEALVMKLGLWEDAKTLRDCYAQIQGDDQRGMMVDFMPVGFGVPRRVHGRREQVAAQSLTVLAKMLEKPTVAAEARRLLAELKTYYEAIDQTIAAELGKRWEPLRPERLWKGELERLDEELRARGCDDGIDGVLGRRVLALAILRELAGEVDSTRALPPAVRPRWQLVAPAIRPALTAGSSDTSDEAA